MSDSKPLSLGLNVVGVYVSDLEQAKRFYMDTLGLTDSGDMGPGWLLALGDTVLYLEGGYTPRDPAIAMKEARTAICIESESVESAFATLKKSGVTIVQDYTKYGDDFAMFMVSDPDGNIIEFAGKP